MQNTTLNFAQVTQAIADYVQSCMSAADFLAQVSEWKSDKHRHLVGLVRRYDRDVRRLHRLNSQGLPGDRIHRERNRLFKSFAARACGELRRIQQSRKKGMNVPTISWEQFEADVRRSPLLTGKSDLAQIFPVKKASGGIRMITNPGPRSRAAHYQAANILVAAGLTNPAEFNCAKKGREKALAALHDLVLQGCYYFVDFDVQNNFSSVRPNHLTELKLPRQVTDAVFMTRVGLTIYNGVKAKSAPHGLPQGAPASAVIASALLGREICQIGGVLATVAYQDGGLIGASGHCEAAGVAKALEQRLAKLSGGPMKLKYVEVRDVRDGLEFLRYWIRAIEVGGELQVHFSPSHASLKKFKRSLFSKLAKGNAKPSYDQAIAVLEAYRSKWLKNFALWAPDEFEMETFLGITECWVDDFLCLKTV